MHFNYLARVTEYGDPTDISFIGLLDSPEANMIHAYLRCVRHSKRIQADQLIDRYVSRGVSPDNAQKVEIAELLIAAQEEGHKKNFVVGSPLAPGKGCDYVRFSETSLVNSTDSKKPIYISIGGPIAGGRLFNFLWLLNAIRQDIDAFRNYTRLKETLQGIVKSTPDNIKWIATLDDDFYGTYY